MKLEKIILGTMVLCLMSSSSVCYAAPYACSYKDEVRGVSVSGELFDNEKTAEQSCEWLKNPFFSEGNPDGFNDCVRGYQLMQKVYNEGNCKPIIKQTHTSGDTTCTVEYYVDDNNKKHRRTSTCLGPNSEFKKQVENMYK